MKVKFSIHTIPVAKQRPRVCKNGHVYTPSKTKVFEQICKLSYKYHYFDKEYIMVKISFMFEVPKSYTKKKREEALEGKIRPTKADIDNYVKSVLDGLNGVAWSDDRYIAVVMAEKVFAEKSEIMVQIENI